MLRDRSDFEEAEVPRLTDARRNLRRRQITEAAVRCFSRNGLASTSIADITAESGLSAGSLYAHYPSKAELIQAVARAVIEEHAVRLGTYAAGPNPPGPDELLARMVAGIDRAHARVGVQMWGEATTDEALRSIVTEMTASLRALLHDYVTTWLTRTEHTEPGEAREQATRIVQQIMMSYQAQLLQAALLSEPEPSSGAQ
ncbi:TetR/AcrR family transcriptional regulator [Streptomyces prasinus]|uniref:TetR/AcrR family transcriptional regulator n=1 Tax=Streptomyces prasinus TaxID=67345 RepID=UPI0033A1D8B2